MDQFLKTKWSLLNDTQRRGILLLAILLLGYLGYMLSFRHALNAMALRRELAFVKQNDNIGGGQLPMWNRKLAYGRTALSAYKVDSVDREAKLWQAVSGMAIAKGITVGFQQQAMALDTAALAQHVVTQQFVFKGKYANLVQMLDTLSTAVKVGRVTEFVLLKPKTVESTDNELQLQVNITQLIN